MWVLLFWPEDGSPMYSDKALKCVMSIKASITPVLSGRR